MMLPNSAAPTTGADSTRPDKPWQIYILRGDGWVPVGACGSRALAESQANTLRRLMRQTQFTVVWEGECDGAA